MERDIEEVLTRGVSEIIDKETLQHKLSSGTKLRIKLGIDPTSPNIHIGRAVLLWKLRAFQELGHTAVFIIGDSTGVVGDTSDKESERPMLTKTEVEANMKSYFDQVFKILDPKKTETHHNSEWLDKLGLQELAKMASLFGLHEFASREVISRRIDAGQRVSFMELMYPLMQGYDSVAVKADVELGGTDQRFNLLTGRKIQPFYGQEPQCIVMTKLIDGLDGRKMSSSWGNTINITAAPEDMYGKVMSMADSQIVTYFEMCTRIPMSEVETMPAELESGKVHPKDLKMRLAREIVQMYHGSDAALQAENNFVETFSNRGLPTDIQSASAVMGTKIMDILVTENVVESKSEWRRLVDEGAVSNAETDEAITYADATLESPITLKVGKRRFIKIEVL